jgi:hypothetical protein
MAACVQARTNTGDVALIVPVISSPGRVGGAGRVEHAVGRLVCVPIVDRGQHQAGRRTGAIWTSPRRLCDQDHVRVLTQDRRRNALKDAVSVPTSRWFIAGASGARSIRSRSSVCLLIGGSCGRSSPPAWSTAEPVVPVGKMIPLLHIRHHLGAQLFDRKDLVGDSAAEYRDEAALTGVDPVRATSRLRRKVDLMLLWLLGSIVREPAFEYSSVSSGSTSRLTRRRARHARNISGHPLSGAGPSPPLRQARAGRLRRRTWERDRHPAREA